jgi:hypothetical protein
MKTVLMTILIIAAVSTTANAVVVTAPGYTVEIYATYTDSVKGIPRHMTFDANGNLYVTQQDSGTIWRVTPSRVASQFASGFTAPYSIAWGGGTAYGDYLYVGALNMYKVDLNGNKTFFTSSTCTGSLTIDRTLAGNYGGYLYVGTGCADDVEKIDTAGNILFFSAWPGPTDGGAPYGIAFDPGAAYGGLMYVGSAYTPNNASKSGIFAMSTGGTPTRFCSNLVQVTDVSFDKAGLFGGLLFAIGSTSYQSPTGIFSVGVDGIATEFATSTMVNAHGLAFGTDGAMYISEYSSPDGSVIISRIAPVLPAVPVANADGPYTIYAGDTLTLDASGSTDEDNDIISYQWDLDDDGSFETDAGNKPVFDVDFAYLQSLGLVVGNTYNIHLKVTDSFGQSDVNDTTLTILPRPDVPVIVDILPRVCPNPININVKCQGVIPVAILGTKDFDVRTIDPNSVRLVGVEPSRCFAYGDVATPVSDTNDCNCTTAGPDGFLDLTLKFDTQKIIEAIGDVNEGDTLIMVLTGKLRNTIPYETTIEGSDCIIICGAKEPKKRKCGHHDRDGWRDRDGWCDRDGWHDRDEWRDRNDRNYRNERDNRGWNYRW